MKNMMNVTPVAICPVQTYDFQTIYDSLVCMAENLHMESRHFAGKKIVIKPNLVAPMKPEEAATTHPVFLAAVAAFLRTFGAGELWIAESPGGVYSEATLRHIYKSCQILETAASCQILLNYDTESVSVSYPDGKVCRLFSVIRPIEDADVIIDLCKLKSHSLTRMSCAVKNLFGVIPGIQKFEMHSAYPHVEQFSDMLVDLCSMLCERHEVWAICDAITAMEGNGPTGGVPREIGAVLMSASPFCLDVAAEALIGFSKTVPITTAAAARGLCPEDISQIPILGQKISDLSVTDFCEPDASRKTFLQKLPHLFGGKLAEFFSPTPVIDRKRCIGCGVCANSCPRHTIQIQNKRQKKTAVILRQDCIHCFCCQELCPIHAIQIHTNPLTTLLH